MKKDIKKSRFIALLLNIFMGSGYIYIGKVKKAFSFILFEISILVIGLVLEKYLPFSFLVSNIIYILVWLYSFIDIYREFPLKSINIKYSKWYFVVAFIILNIVLNLIAYKLSFKYLPTKHFYMPSESMQNTIYKYDYIVAKKDKDLKRGNLVIFSRNGSYYLKRVVAKEGDEIIYADNKIYIHFSDLNINNKSIKILNKYWEINPYKNIYKGIHYSKNSIFKYLINYRNSMEPICIKELNVSCQTNSNGKSFNAFYKKIDSGFFVLGDNRDKSLDSRFYGTIEKENIYGKPIRVYFNLKNFSRFNIELK